MSNRLDLEIKAKLWGSLILFCEYFYPRLTGRPFIIPCPISRESHVYTISKALTRCARLESLRVVVNVPPGHSKSLMCCMFVAQQMSQWPDSKFMYISYSKSLSAKHTEFIRRIMQLPDYKKIFEVHIPYNASGKEFFQTAQGGAVAAFGSAGSITGFDAGLPGLSRFSGAILIDDAHKPDEVHSDTMRQSVIDNYRETIQQRARGIYVPTIFVGQRLHEDDLPNYLLCGQDGHAWERVVIPSIDAAGNALYPEAFPLSLLRIRQERDPYVFSSQHQQEPIPAGGALFKPSHFITLDADPQFICTFITADTAETDKSYNDATAFSFWGLYKIQEAGQETDTLALHWIDCVELRVEPKDLYDEFMSFYGECMLHKTQPRIALIEKKSTGVTLLSVLSDMRGLNIREVKRTKASGSKTVRFLEMQPIIASKLISFTRDAKHVELCVNHMAKITANESHRHDDICDTAYDAIKTALIDKTLFQTANRENDLLVKQMAGTFNKRLSAFGDRYA